MFVFSLTGQFGARLCFNVDQALCWWSKVCLGYSCSIRLSFTFPWPLVVEHSDPAEERQSLRCDFSSTGLSSSGLPLRWTLSPLPLPQTFVLTVGRVGQLESQRATSHLVFLSLVRPPERPAHVSRGPSPPSPVSRLTRSSVSRSGWRESGCDADTVGH